MEIIPNNEPTPLHNVPLPAVSDTFGHGWDTLKKFFPELVLVFFIQALLSLPMGFSALLFDPVVYGMLTLNVFNVLYGIAVMMPVSFGISWVYLKALRGEDFRVQDIFFAYQHFIEVLLANLLMGLIIGLGILLLIVPGIIFACKLAFVPYLVMDRNLSATEAVRQSWRMTKGHAGTIFLMGLMSILVALAGLICLIIGIIPAGIWIGLAFAAMYAAVDASRVEENPRV